MFGTIAHATLKPGQEAQLTTLMEDWQREIRPQIPGPVVQLTGHQAGHPDQIVFMALTQDEATCRTLAAMPEQHQFYLRFNEVFPGEPRWSGTYASDLVCAPRPARRERRSWRLLPCG